MLLLIVINTVFFNFYLNSRVCSSNLTSMQFVNVLFSLLSFLEIENLAISFSPFLFNLTLYLFAKFYMQCSVLPLPDDPNFIVVILIYYGNIKTLK